MLTLISVSQVEKQYIEGTKDICMKNIQNETVKFNTSTDDKENGGLYIKSTLSECVSEFTNAISQSKLTSLPHFIIVDDLLSFGFQNNAVIQNIRNVRSLVEDSFSVSDFFTCKE